MDLAPSAITLQLSQRYWLPTAVSLSFLEWQVDALHTLASRGAECSQFQRQERTLPSLLILSPNVGDPDPQKPHVFGPPGSGSITQMYGSGSFPFLINVLSGLK